MKTNTMLRFAAGALALLGVSVSGAAQAAEGTVVPPHNNWSFSGPFGKYDPTQLQRGFKVYREVCSNCHSIRLLKFRNLAEEGGPMFSEAQVKALAAEYKVTDGPNDSGDMFQRPGRPADAFPPPFPNPQAAAAANGGAIPPDFSVIAKARTYERGFPWFVFDMFTQFQEQGVDYISALLTGYKEPEHGVEVPAGKYYNEYFPGHIISMPPPISDGQVEYPKGADGKAQAPETIAQYGKDVAAFLMWAAEPHLEARKELGFRILVFLLLFAGLLYFTKKKIWSRVEGHAVTH
ncbi:cytochrome c1 [Alsobacter soli]|uniref:Cytochrome c1 n=1 Tax=Alsobacter soli TaxID=2109933 RepID=A0A2T1HZ05_9HYPH|nr:cytochrome c1 [Alsobacter soli]PSC06844.1 cytochrome c1 [Alsobacter soli]